MEVDNNVCVICGKTFYNWFHGQGMKCYDCSETEYPNNVCVVSLYSSRACEKGTKGCDIKHG
jgi:hypothetical protein